jgi:tetratricopeptide (TPR) repeat protein
MTDEVVRLLIPNGRPHDFESELWDYKEILPVAHVAASDEQSRQHKAELGDIIKDVVAFHNAYGGYIVFGVSDRGRDRFHGCTGLFDVGDLNKRIQHFTETNIECIFRTIEFSIGGDARVLGLLLVPRRLAGTPPVAFRKKGPEKNRGERCFSEGTYVRVRDECRPAAATSADWQFLHSDRNPPHTAAPSAAHRMIRTVLSARDSDLVEFVGRTETLETLRLWLLDSRSPVRLISGIGGLGKTSVAYRFVEDVIEANPQNLEWVIWLTAKQQTFSALRGRLVATGKTDFADLKGLLRAILGHLSYDFDDDVDDLELGEIVERVVEALETYSCLIVVDDIDSLTPDEQRETVATLNGIALRSVGRGIPPSRMLMTSRIDQGLPPTAVVKIFGLDRVSFDQHVLNLCETFRVAPIYGTTLEEMYEVTSGSPLFAASVVRLLSLGEGIKNVLDTWRGQDGEEVRRFAFEREIGRMDSAQGRLLYAVLLLGETSVVDLATILEMTPKAIRDRISELQAYHLLATTTKQNGDTAIIAPGELATVKEILRKHIAAYATDVERACAQAEELSRADNRTVGVGIRAIVNLWNSAKYAEALHYAEELRKKHPKNADVLSFLGSAILQCMPPDYRKADKELSYAYDMGCTRPELFSNMVRAKIGMEDWSGLHQLTRKLSSNDVNRDEPLEAFIHASTMLISIAKDRGDYSRASDLAIQAVEKIASKTSRLRLSEGLFLRLNGRRLDLAREHINALGRINTRPGDKLNIFEGVVRLFNADAVLADLIRHGVASLQTWWVDVEHRPVLDHAACSILARQLQKLEKMEKHLATFKSVNDELLQDLQNARRELEYRGAQLMG